MPATDPLAKIRTYSAVQLSEAIGVSNETIRRWTRDGILPRPLWLSPGCVRWRASDIERWLDRETFASDHADDPAEILTAE